MKRSILFLIGIFIVAHISAQGTYEVKLMSWNVLNWPNVSNLASDSTQRCPAYRTVVNYAQPDILMTCENTSNSSTPIFLNQVMNTGSYHYASGTFINGYDTDNTIYYRDSLFDFVSNVPIHTALRDISHFTLVFKMTGDTIHLFCCHLKASQGYEVQRGAEIANLRQVTNAFPAGTNFFIGGDFNLYNDSEPAYLNLLQDNASDDGNFLDLLHLTGTWNNSSYAHYHTQSTHYSSTPTFSGGGLDDRFDMILFSNAVSQPGGVTYVPGSYINIGNDGNHYNRDINYGNNSAVGPAVANALYNASDHLPIMLTMSFDLSSGIAEANNIYSDVRVYPDPISDYSKVQFTLKHKCNVSYYLSDALGHVIENGPSNLYEQGDHFLPVDWEKLQNSGFYFLSIKFDNTLINKKIILIR